MLSTHCRQDRYYDAMKGRSHQYWHMDQDNRLVSRATGEVVAADAFNSTGELGLVRKVTDEDRKFGSE